MKKLLLLLLTFAASQGLYSAPNEHAADDLFWSQASALLPGFTGNPATPPLSSRAGLWGPVLPWTHTPVTLAVLPNGKLLTFSGQEPEMWPGTKTQTHWALWNPSTGQFDNQLYQDHEMFCAHPVMRTDGVLQTMGGRYTVRDSSTYDWRTNRWRRVSNMNDPRWYTTSVAIRITDVVGATGLLAHLRINGELLASSSDWKVSHSAPSGWEQPNFDDSSWASATEHGDLGSAPWGQVNGFPEESEAKWIWSSNLNNRNELYLRIKVGELSLTHQAPSEIFLNTNLNHSVSAQGGVPPYTFSQSGLPAGLTLDPVSGVITGLPSETGTRNVTLSVTDSQSGQVSVTQSWTVFGSLLLAEDFESNDGGFRYLDDAFLGTNNPAYASGVNALQSRVAGSSLQALYTFDQGASPNTVYDHFRKCGSAEPLDCGPLSNTLE